MGNKPALVPPFLPPNPRGLSLDRFSALQIVTNRLS